MSQLHRTVTTVRPGISQSTDAFKFRSKLEKLFFFVESFFLRMKNLQPLVNSVNNIYFNPNPRTFLSTNKSGLKIRRRKNSLVKRINQFSSESCSYIIFFKDKKSCFLLWSVWIYLYEINCSAGELRSNQSNHPFKIKECEKQTEDDRTESNQMK